MDLEKQHPFLVPKKGKTTPHIGMPLMMSFAIGSPVQGKGPLLFLGFTKESWLPQMSLYEKASASRKARFTHRQLEDHGAIRNAFCEVTEEVKRAKGISANDDNLEKRVQNRALSIRAYWEEHPPRPHFSECIAISFPDLVVRQKCVICKATSSCPRDNAQSLERDLQEAKSLYWLVKKDNLDCAEIMTAAGYEDLQSWSDGSQQGITDGSQQELTLAPPKCQKGSG